MYIERLVIQNFKIFKNISIDFNKGVNIIVGNNEVGKTTILEAIHLVLSGLINGKYIKNELSQYLFNKEIEYEYIQSLKTEKPIFPPTIVIEAFIGGADLPIFEGNGNSEKQKKCGIVMKMEFDTDFNDEYNALIETGDIYTIPIEYYKISWSSCAREQVTSRSIPLKSVLIDSSAYRYQNGSDLYLAKIIKDELEDSEIVGISQAYRKLKEAFMNDASIKAINSKITREAALTQKEMKISVDMSVRNSWETLLMTYLEDIPFHQIGKGEQCMIKTNLALSHKKAKESNLILIEEPENHLSFSKLNRFVDSIKTRCTEKQIIISTHNSFIANKLELKNLILLCNNTQISLSELSQSTYDFFKKLSGYETLRLILSKKAILVEGPSDELIVQRAYMDKHKGRLPIDDEIDVISVGLSFERFLEIAKMLKKPTAIVTDNDRDYERKIKRKYSKYNDDNFIKICADNRNELNTLEPQIVDANKDNLKMLCEIMGVDYTKYDCDTLSKYMQENKTDCALHIFESSNKITYPQYILSAVEWGDEE